jgi:hypothetical protein
VIYGTAIQRGVSAVHARWQVYAYIDAYSFWLIYGVLIRCLVLPVATGWIVATTMRLRPVLAALALALSSALRNLIPLVMRTWSATRYWPTHPFLARSDRSFFIEVLTLASLAFVSTLVGAALARKYQPVSKSEPITT